MDIMSGLTAVSETLKITKELRSIENNIDKAELKLRLADLIDGLLEAKEALQDAKQREIDLLDEIKKMKEQFVDRSRYEDENGLLYKLNESNEREGEPFCNLCFVRESKLYRMRFRAAKRGTLPHYFCDNHKGGIVVD